MSSGHQEDVPSDRTELFLKLYGQCQRPLYMFIASLLPYSSTDAQDVLQETSLVLWAKFDEFDQERSFYAWARGIAYRKVLKSRERGARQARVFKQETIELLATDLDRRDQDADQTLASALTHCLGRLTKEDRDLVRQRYAPGASVQTIAAQLGRSPNALSQALRRIRRALFECITRRVAAEARGV